MALHLTSLGDQESRGKMPDNCCIYQGNEFIAVEFLQQNKGLHYESTLVILTKVGAGLDSSSGRGRRCFASQWLEIFWLPGWDVVLLSCPPRAVSDLV